MFRCTGLFMLRASFFLYLLYAKPQQAYAVGSCPILEETKPYIRISSAALGGRVVSALFTSLPLLPPAQLLTWSDAQMICWTNQCNI